MKSVTVVGSGMTGATAARVLANFGCRVSVVDRRDVVSGNMHDPILSSGHKVHKYGPHVFHTNSQEVYVFLSNFTEWRPYEHRAVANIGGTVVPVPFNFTSIELLLPNSDEIVEHLSSRYEQNEHVAILKLLKSDDEIEKQVADYAYKNVFEFYTKKQWGLSPTELSPSVTARVPIRMGYDDRYFTDKYQLMPVDGYHAMIEKMLDHPRIDTELNKSFSIADIETSDCVLFTGPLDELLEYRFGVLPYRSLSFSFEEHEGSSYLPAGAMNFTVSEDYTRIADYSIIEDSSDRDTTVVSKEFPEQFQPGVNEAYYPVPVSENTRLYNEYRDYLKDNYPNVHLAGRLADYKYYNMDQACKRGLIAASEMMSYYELL